MAREGQGGRVERTQALGKKLGAEILAVCALIRLNLKFLHLKDKHHITLLALVRICRCEKSLGCGKERSEIQGGSEHMVNRTDSVRRGFPMESGIRDPLPRQGIEEGCGRSGPWVQLFPTPTKSLAPSTHARQKYSSQSLTFLRKGLISGR
jgi:hypothetical protein